MGKTLKANPDNLPHSQHIYRNGKWVGCITYPAKDRVGYSPEWKSEEDMDDFIYKHFPCE